ncbi:MAG: hypothetical protein CVU05_12600 [Bacteroidetes bacterium HGW-Bacteroidetes-21]|jgi:MATE family multidrug resistance protein|nr:MAG: hypothetical protein CVU05_12600 [Bacteroidetes bacterium HGW-Bacteroidetes-21]
MKNIFKNYFSGYNKPGGIRELLLIALPMIISTAADGIMTFTDRLFLAQIGPEQMNAALGGGIALLTFTFFFTGLSGYSTALVAQYLGAGQKDKTTVTAFQAMLIVIFAWPVIVLLLPVMKWFFTTAELPQAQMALQLQYIQILAWGSLAGMLRHALSCYFSGLGKTRIVMTATLAALAVNVILDYILIFGKLGLPVMGIRGAAIATVSGAATAALILFMAYLNRVNRTEYGVLRSFHFDGSVMKKLLYFGSPAGFEMLLNFIAFSVVVTMFQSRGDVAATATTVMFNWDLMSFIPLLGVEIAVTSLVGRYMGAGRPQVAHRSAISGVKTGMFYSVIVLVFFVFFPHWLVEIFSPDVPNDVFTNAIPTAVSMIQIASLYVLAESMMVAFIGALRGAGDTYFTMFASVTLHWLMVPVLYFTLKVWELPITTSWFIIVLLFLLFCGALYLRFRGGKWKTIKVVK